MLKLGHKWTQVDTSGQRCFGLLYLCTRNQKHHAAHPIHVTDQRQADGRTSSFEYSIVATRICRNRRAYSRPKRGL